MDKKEIQKKRMMGYFIEAANNIIENEGIEHVTIRKVADSAGYNSATLYNYFENLEHLIFFASMKYVSDYILDLPSYLKDCKNCLEKFYKIWECFCKHSFNKPKRYNTIFYGNFKSSLGDAIEEYYSIFPEELDKIPNGLHKMLTKQNIYDRDRAILECCAEEGFIKENDIDEINEMVMLVYQGMLWNVINERVHYTSGEASNRVLTYIQRTLESYRIKKIN